MNTLSAPSQTEPLCALGQGSSSPTASGSYCGIYTFWYIYYIDMYIYPSVIMDNNF